MTLQVMTLTLLITRQGRMYSKVMLKTICVHVSCVHVYVWEESFGSNSCNYLNQNAGLLKISK